MANIKSAKKRIGTSQRKAEANKAVKTGIKSAVKKVNTAIEAGDKEAAQAALKDAESKIDKAAIKGVIKKNNASRKVSRMSEKIDKLA